MKARIGVGIIRFMSKYVSRDVLDQMYKLYVRPHLDYGDLICHKDDPEASLSLTKIFESVQYTAALGPGKVLTKVNSLTNLVGSISITEEGIVG